MSGSADLLRLLGQEPKGVPDELWAEAEEHLGLVFPGDYKELMSALGNGVFDHVVEVMSPIADDESLDDYLSDLHEAPDGLVPWGTADRGVTFFWRTGGEPDRWTITLCDAGFSTWEDHDGPVSAFLHDLLTGGFRSGLLDFTPTRNPGFWPR
ncbi:SMI1/KNR4 family protein [Lentzea sp. NPDC058436]|uniref:SMI1/KNR4 family protein n=1 Tax=Lentzea sp. NPDC058436 TaxID=3346499 RepID=UPI0036499F3A